MEKCLVTKLKSVIADESLPILGCLRLKVIPGSYPTVGKRAIGFASDDGVVVVSVSNGLNLISTNSDFSNPTNKVELSNATLFNAKSIYCLPYEKEYYIDVYKYPLCVIGNTTASSTEDACFSFDISELEYSESLTRFVIYYNRNVVGDISVLSDKTSITELNLTQTGCYGNLSSLSRLVSLESLTIYNADINGTVEELCSRLNANGKTSGTMSIRISKTKVTYQSSVTDITVSVTFSDSGYEFSAL